MNDQGKIGMNGSRMDATREVGVYGSGLSAPPRLRIRRRTFAMRHAGAVGLLVCVAAIVVVSAFSLVSSGNQKALQRLEVPAGTLAPPPPYLVLGFTYADNSTGGVVPNCNVNITNLNTGLYNLTTSDPVYGYYEFNLNDIDGGWTVGDIIRVTADNGAMSGSNESVATGAGGFLWIDVTLDTVIPEFPMVIVPVVGMLALVAVVSLNRRRGEL